MPTRAIRLLPLLLLAPGLATAQPAAPAKTAVTYKVDVLSVLRKHGLNCHNADKASSDLNVATYQALMTGGASGEAVRPGSPDQSLLYRLTTHQAEPKMPPKGPKVPDAELAVIKKWIEAGAPETAVGAAKTAARKLDIDPVTVSLGKPDGPPPMPGTLPAVILPKTPRPHPVTALAASPWAPLLAVAGHERVLLYHTDTLKLLGALPFPERIPHVLRFSRNGKWLLAAGGRGASAGRVVIWDVATGGLRYKVKKHTDWVTALEFSPDGALLATGDRAGGAHVWEAATGGSVFALGDHRDAVTALSWRADSQMLASASEDGRVILWYAEDGFPARSFTPPADGRGGERPGRPGCWRSSTPGMANSSRPGGTTRPGSGNRTAARRSAWTGSPTCRRGRRSPTTASGSSSAASRARSGPGP